MLRVIVRGVRTPEDVEAAAAAGADAVTFVTESKGEPGNLDITEVVETARLAPPLLAVLVESTTLEESRLRRAIGSAHPHAVVIPISVDPLVLADLQVGFPELKWMARLKAAEWEPFHDTADALVFDVAEREAVAKIKEASRARLVLENVTEENAAEAVAVVRPFAIMTGAADRASLTRVIHAARNAALGG